MSINILFNPNDFNLNSNSITVNTATVSGTLNIDGTIAIDGDLALQANKNISMGSWVGTDNSIPDHIKLFDDSYGLGVTAGNLNIIAATNDSINQNVGSNTITTANNGAYVINRNTQIDSGSASIQSQLNINTDNVTPNNCDIVLGNSTGYYAIQRTGNNKELSIFQFGDSVDTNIVLSTGAGQIVQNGSGGIQCNGGLTVNGTSSVIDIKINNSLLDSTNSAGTNGQVLTTTGTQTLWASSTSIAENQIFLNSNGGTINSDIFIGLSGITITGASASYAFAKQSTITGMFVQINAAPGNLNFWIFHLQKNGVDNLLTVSFTDNTTQNSNIGNVAFNAGDNYTVRIEKVGTPPDITSCLVTLIYQ